MVDVGTNQNVAKAGGRVALADEEKRARAARARLLREQLGMTQEQFADASGGAFQRPTVPAIEKGKNLATSALIQRGMAAVLGGAVRQEDVAVYLDGKLSVHDLLARRDGTTRKRIVGPSLLEVVARNQNRWSVDAVLAVEAAEYHGGVPKHGWEKALDDATAQIASVAEPTGHARSADVPSGHGTRGDRTRAARTRTT